MEAPLILAMEGAGRAVIRKGLEYHLVNPASAVYFRRTQSMGFYVFDEDASYWGFSLLEGRYTPFILSWIGERESKQQMLVISVAGNILPGWSLGLSLSRWQNKMAEHYWNMQSGLMIRPKGQEALTLGLTWDHILPLKGVFKNERKWGLGIGYQIQSWLNIRSDMTYYPFHSMDDRWFIIGGMDVILAQFLVLRGATRWNMTAHVFQFSGGWGLHGKYFHFDHSIRRHQDMSWIHGFSVRMVR